MTPTRWDRLADMGPDQAPLAAVAGYPIALSLTFYADAAQTTPINLTGYSAKLTVKPTGASAIEVTTANSGIALGGAAGTLVANSANVLPSAPTPPAAGKHDWQLEVLGPTGTLEFFFFGKWDFLGDLTP